MKKGKVFLATVVSLLVIVFAPMAYAYTIATGGSWGPYQTGQGGEFTLTPGGGLEIVLGQYAAVAKDQGVNGTFQTFCMEGTETISLNTVYSAALSNAAVAGGGGAVGGSDPLSVGTAWLYYQFATGTLAGYNYGAGRTTTAGALQQAIWWLEDEANSTADPTTNTFLLAVAAKFGSTLAGKADNAGEYAIMVANLTAASGGFAQDVLVLKPVPLPAAVWLLGAGLIGLVGIRRRMQA